MKLKKSLLLIFTILPLLVAVIALFFLPDRIPAHYGPNFVVDRFGSKYEILILPLIILAMGAVFLITSFAIKQETALKVALNIELAFLLFFNALCYYLLYIQGKGLKFLRSETIGFERFLLLGFGIFFIYIGNLMPMVRKNSFIGLRTTWSKKNDTVWKKCQLFCGISMIATGVICLILAFVFPNLFLMVGVLIAVGVIDTVYSYFAAKRDTSPVTDES